MFGIVGSGGETELLRGKKDVHTDGKVICKVRFLAAVMESSEKESWSNFDSHQNSYCRRLTTFHNSLKLAAIPGVVGVKGMESISSSALLACMSVSACMKWHKLRTVMPVHNKTYS